MNLRGVRGLADHEPAEPFVAKIEGALGLVGQRPEQQFGVSVAVLRPAVGDDLPRDARDDLVLHGLAHLVDALGELQLDGHAVERVDAVGDAVVPTQVEFCARIGHEHEVILSFHSGAPF